MELVKAEIKMDSRALKRAIKYLFLFGFISFVVVYYSISLFNRYFLLVHTVTNSNLYTSFICTQKVYTADELSDGDFIFFVYQGEKEYPRYDVVRGQKMVKEVGALPEQKVRIDGKHVFIDGQMVASIMKTDLEGRKVGFYFSYDGVVPKGKVFVLSPHPYSFDSRYWGFVREKWKLHKCWPLPLSEL